jgi:hypothetical protein
MPGCTKNCENCGPALSIYGIGASAQFSAGAYGCVGEGSLPEGTLGYSNYSSQCSSSSGSSANLDATADIAEGTKWIFKNNSQSEGNGNFSENSTINRKVDKYGSYIENTIYKSTFDANSSSSFDGLTDYACSFPGGTSKSSSMQQGKIKCFTVPCPEPPTCKPPSTPCGYIKCEPSCSSSYNSTTTFKTCAGGGDSFSQSGTGEDCGGVGSCNTQGGCTQVQCNEQTQSSYDDSYSSETVNAVDIGSSQSSVNCKKSVSGVVTRQMMKGYSMSSVNTRMGIYETNRAQNVCGTKCGEDNDACWGGANGFEVIDNTNSSYYSRIKLKIAADKEAMKDYSSVEGKSYFYENTVPSCCGDGSPIFESTFTIGKTPNFKNNTLCATAFYNLDNDQSQAYKGSTIVWCAKITKVNF